MHQIPSEKHQPSGKCFTTRPAGGKFFSRQGFCLRNKNRLHKGIAILTKPLANAFRLCRRCQSEDISDRPYIRSRGKLSGLPSQACQASSTRFLSETKSHSTKHCSDKVFIPGETGSIFLSCPPFQRTEQACGLITIFATFIRCKSTPEAGILHSQRRICLVMANGSTVATRNPKNVSAFIFVQVLKL